MDISASLTSLIASVGVIFVTLMLALMLAMFQAKITVYSFTDNEGFNAIIKFSSVYGKNKGSSNETGS